MPPHDAGGTRRKKLGILSEISYQFCVSSRPKQSTFPEYAVRRETISAYFQPPLARSTFHSLVNQGKIVPLEGLKGFYKLNASLRLLGLRETAKLPNETKRTVSEIIQLAFHLIDPVVFPSPTWLLVADELTVSEADHGRRVADQHRDAISALPSSDEKHAYFAGVLESQQLMETMDDPAP